MLRARSLLFALGCIGALLGPLAGGAGAQPASFYNLGSIAAPATPASTQREIGQPGFGAFDLGGIGEPGELLSVKWIRFDVVGGITGPLFLDIDTRISNIEGPLGDLFAAVYDNAGRLIATDDGDGTSPPGLAAGLSFGSTGLRANGTTPLLTGQDGPLPAGRYWLALAAGGAANVTAAPTNWGVTTSLSYRLGYPRPGLAVYRPEVHFSVGNTTALPAPSNDSCGQALTIGENPIGGLAWEGGNDGATTDGASGCYPEGLPPSQQAKDIWFRYVPTFTGVAEAIVNRPTGSSLRPVLTRFGGGCGSQPVRCVRPPGFFPTDEGVRMTFAATEGEPVLLSLSALDGRTGPLNLSVRPLRASEPPEYADLGTIAAAATPPSNSTYIERPRGLFEAGGSGVLTVQWVRFDLGEDISGDLFFDIDTQISSADLGPSGLFLALYDDSGALVATDDTHGGFPEGLAAGLSFGSSGFRANIQTPFLTGQNGSLPRGRYWLAVAAGDEGNNVTAGPTDWNVTTNAAYPLGFPIGAYSAEISFVLGNTTPLPAPSNDQCENALPIGENPIGGLAWTGGNDGATNDGFNRCYQGGRGGYEARDIWFLYTPTASGLAEVVAETPSNSGLSPVLTRYQGGCNSSAAQCTTLTGLLSTLPGIRLYFPVVAGEPVLLSLSAQAAGTGPLSLSVRLVPPACPLQIPAGAVRESEADCGGDRLNDGCNSSPPAFDQLVVGRAVYGTLFLGDFTRDADWFEFTLDQAAEVTLTFSAQYPAEAFIFGPELNPGACFGNPILVLEGPGFSERCGSTSGSIALPAGTHRAAINQSLIATGLSCGDGYEGYWLRVDAPGVNPPCRADYNADGTVDPDDLADFITCYFDATPCGRADYSGDGVADPDDLADFIAAYFAGCP